MTDTKAINEHIDELLEVLPELQQIQADPIKKDKYWGLLPDIELRDPGNHLYTIFYDRDRFWSVENYKPQQVTKLFDLSPVDFKLHLDQCDLDGIKILFTALIKGERFEDGWIARHIENGKAIAILVRLQVIRGQIGMEHDKT